MFHVVALAPWPMRIMEIIPFIRWSFFGLTDSREYLFLFCELLLCWPKSRSHSFLQHHHHLGCHATESTRLNVEKKMLKIWTEWVQNIYEVRLECLSSNNIFHRLNAENFENNLFKSWNKKMRLQKGFGNIVKT